jgi:glycosyltransferase involved in cell wall biosynthesis
MPSFGSGGAERVVFNLLSNMPENQFKLELLVLSKAGFLSKRLPSNVLVKEIYRSRLLFAIDELWMALNSDADLVFCSGYHNPLIALIAYASGKSHKLILRETSVVSAAKGRWKAMPILKAVVPMFYNSCRGVIFQSNYGKKDFENYFQFNLNNSSVLMNPAIMVNELNIQAYSIFLVGTLNANKNQQMALHSLYESGMRGFRVEVFGDGPERKNLEKYVSQSKFDFEVIFHGTVSNMEEHWKRARLHVLTSRFESMPNVVIEAAMNGVPSVCLNVPGGLAELFELGNWGKLVDDPESLAEEIERIYGLDKMSREKMAKEAKNLFQIEATNKYINYFNSI